MAPLNKSHVKQRSQAGRSLSYIEGWHAIDEANRIFGFDGWDRELATLKELGEPRQVDGKWRVAYMATVRIRVWAGSDIPRLVRDGTGYGSGIDKDLGQAHESAIKEAETDAMKRALMTFGNPFGLALYDKEQKNVVTESAPSRAGAEMAGGEASNRATSPSAAPQQDAFGLPPLEEKGERSIANTLISALKQSKTDAELTNWFRENKATIRDLPGELQDEIVHAGTVHRSALQYAKETA